MSLAAVSADGEHGLGSVTEDGGDEGGGGQRGHAAGQIDASGTLHPRGEIGVEHAQHHPPPGGPRPGQESALKVGHVVFRHRQERPCRPQSKAVEGRPGRHVADDDREMQTLDERRVERVLVALDGDAADSRLVQGLDDGGAGRANAAETPTR
jgi:hypothetical protein